MKKRLMFMIFICTMLIFTSCAVPKVKSDATASPNENATTASAPAGQSDSAETTDVSAEPNDSGLTLAGIKKAAQETGYETEAVQDYQMIDEPKPADSFNLIYEDDYTSAYIPVLEFKNTDDAKTYAKQVNEAGYNICIMNGKFLTMTSAQYGVAINDNQTAVLETLLQSKVMEYTEPAYIPLKPAQDYAGAYLHVDAIYTAVDKLINKSVLLSDKAVPEEERISAAFVTFTLLSSGDLSFTSVLCEDQLQLDAIVQLWEMFGATDVKLKHDTAHDYVLTGKRAGMDTTFELHCTFSPETGALRLIDTDGGQIIEFYEFVPLGDDTYAFQTLYSRAIVEYKDGKVLSFIYSLNKQDTAAYDPASDGIYDNGTGADEAWVSAAGEDSYEQFITYDGTTIKIAADSFMGDRLDVAIKAQ